MKPLLLLIITIVFSSNIYAEPEELDREKYNYRCDGDDIRVDKHGNTGCKGIRKGDVLRDLFAVDVLLYCDRNQPILETFEEYDCIYNGNPIKKWKSLK
jgi:hypothetical protein